MPDQPQLNVRRLTACERCRKRKTKCDSEIPSCANCVKAGVECMSFDKVLGKLVSRAYAASLQDRFKAYEELNISIGIGDTSNNPHKRARLSESSNCTRQLAVIESSDSEDAITDAESEGSLSDLPYLQHTAFIKPSRNTIETLLASTFSGGEDIHVSEDLDNQIRRYSTNHDPNSREAFIEREKVAIAKLGRDFLKQGRRNYARDKVTDIAAYDLDILLRLARRFITSMNSAYPVLHECQLLSRIARCRSSQKKVSLVDLFQVKMVVAISLASISRSQVSISEIGRIAHLFWKSATRLDTTILGGRGIERLQNILLLLQYTLLVPMAGNLWQLSGTAMRCATEMGLYAEPNPSQNFDPLTLDLRRRLFWTCYCIDRTLATVLGRPTGIPDSWISTGPPELVEDRLVTITGIKLGPICHLKIGQRQVVRIYRLQSEIHKSLYSIGKRSEQSPEALAYWSWHMYDQLRLWRSSYCHAMPLVTKEWIELQFHLAVVLLFRPSPNRPKLSDEALHIAFHSAGEVMKLVKVMHRDSSMISLWITVQNLFMCGLVYVNSLKELSYNQRESKLCISFYEIFSQIQSCTTSLETLSAVEAGANERIRNAFEMISSSVLQTVANNAANLHRQSNASGGCIWAQIAREEKSILERPTSIGGFTIPILEKLQIMEETDFEQMENSTSHEDFDDHYRAHDMDSTTSNLVFDVPSDESDYFVSKRKIGPVRGDGMNIELNKADDVANRFDTQERVRSQSPRVSTPNFSGFVGQEVTAVRDLGNITPWQQMDLGAELEKWFLYPLSESTGQLPM